VQCIGACTVVSRVKGMPHVAQTMQPKIKDKVTSAVMLIHNMHSLPLDSISVGVHAFVSVCCKT
jgi:hypothetical protein